MNKETILFLKSQKANLKKLIQAGLNVTVSFQPSVVRMLTVQIKTANNYTIAIGTYFVDDNDDITFSKAIDNALIKTYVEKFNNELQKEEVK